MQNKFGDIIRYLKPEQAKSADQGQAAKEIEQHISKHLGEPSLVIHEIGSRYVHIDVHIVPPSPGRDFYTLITSGMSDKPMHPPDKAKNLKFAELMLCLPSSWQMPETYQAVGDVSRPMDWPLLWLRKLARFPHEYKSWLWWGHSMPNGDPAEPLAPDTGLCGWALLEPHLVSEEFKLVRRGDGENTIFLAAVPVYPEEMAFKLAQGSKKLAERFDAVGITELIDPNRANTAFLQ